MSNLNDRQQPVDYPVKGEGVDTEHLFATTEQLKQIREARQSNGQTVNPSDLLIQRICKETYDYGGHETLSISTGPAALSSTTTAPNNVRGLSSSSSMGSPFGAMLCHQNEPQLYTNIFSSGFHGVSQSIQNDGYSPNVQSGPTRQSYPDQRSPLDFEPYSAAAYADPTPTFHLGQQYGQPYWQQYKQQYGLPHCGQPQHGQPPFPAAQSNQQFQNQYQQSESRSHETWMESDEYDADGNEDDSDDDSNHTSTRPPLTEGELDWTFPQFTPIKVFQRMSDEHGENVGVDLECSFLKPLAPLKGPPRHHVQYRRNYMKIKGKYLLNRRGQRPSPGEWLYLNHPETGARMKVEAVGLRLRGVLGDEDGVDADLCLFDSKRLYIGNGSYFVPTRPSNSEAPGDPILYGYSTGHFDRHRVKYQEVSFDHHQFRKATPNNGSRRKAQTFHRVAIDVKALVGQEEITLASRTSGPLETRGRCPKSFESCNKNNPHHNRRKPQTREDGRKKKEQRRAATKKKGSKKVKKAESGEATPSGRTRRQLRSIAAQPTATSSVPTLTFEDSTQTSTLGYSSPSPAMETEEVSYVPDHEQVLRGLASTYQSPPFERQMEEFEDDNLGGLFKGDSEQTGALPAHRSRGGPPMHPSHGLVANTGHRSTATRHSARANPDVSRVPGLEDFLANPNYHSR